MPRALTQRKPRAIRLPEEADAILVAAATEQSISINRAVEVAVREAFGTAAGGRPTVRRRATGSGREAHRADVPPAVPRIPPEQALCEHKLPDGKTAWQILPYMTRCTLCGVRK